ncbi:MAG TPA: efflux RND transporter periplasmic adaptor subunit [Chitinophagaceae bacterium]|nr:efflux RND transporter periplasmic adaptor subunit [Chitinophagaceae bacterium]
MNKFLMIVIIATAVFFTSCGSGAKDVKGDVNDKKVKLEKLKTEKTKIETEIQTLQLEIAKLDPASVVVAPKLVAVTAVSLQPFEHYIDLQGRVDADNISYLTPRGMPAQVRALYVRKGDYVKKGQVLLKLDDAVTLKQLEGLRTQKAYAEDIYKRTKNLWDQGIGTEVQLKTAENNVKSLNDQISTLTESWQMSNVRSEVNGYVEQLNLRVGETFSGYVGNQPQVMIVNSSALKVVTDVPENYLDRVKKGTPVNIKLPDVNLEFNSVISLMNQTIGLNSRSVTTEAKIPYNSNVHINQVALVRIKDYVKDNAIVIPLTTLQTDENGKYVYVLATENGKTVARKKQVVVGEIYGEQIEVRSGLNEGDQLITQGFQSLYEGQGVTTAGSL